MAKMKHDDIKEDKKLIKRAFGMHDKQLHEDKKTDLSKLKKGGITMKKMSSGGPSAATKKSPKAMEDMDMGMKKGGKVKKMAKGGVTGSAMKAVGRNMARANNQKAK